jgi:hypothetical protein
MDLRIVVLIQEVLPRCFNNDWHPMLKHIGSSELTFEAISFMGNRREKVALGLALDREVRVEGFLSDPCTVVSEAVIARLKAVRLHLHWKILELQRSLLAIVLVDCDR